MKVDISEQSRWEILQAIGKGWREVTSQDIPEYLKERLLSLVVRLDNLLQSKHLDELKELAYKEGILIAREQFTL